MNASNNEFILHAARAFFASAWADAVEYSIPGGEIMDAMPDEIDPAAIMEAQTLLADMLRSNYCNDADALLARCPDEGDRPHTVEMLGHYSAMQAMGHGVGLGDAFGNPDCLQVPYVEFTEFSLARSYTV